MRFDSAEDAMLALRSDLKLVRDGLPTATFRAINRALTGGRTRAVKIMGRTYELEAPEIREGIAVRKAFRRRLEGKLVFRGSRSIPLFKFGAQDGYDGVTVKVLRASGRKPITRGFVATMESGHRGVFERGGRARLPIDEMWGPSPLAIWEKEEAAAELYDAIEARFDRELSRQAEHILDQAGVR